MNTRFFFSLVPKVSILKSLYYSFKFKGVIFVGKGCNVNIHRKGRIIFESKKSSLYLGIHFSVPQGATLDIYSGGILKVGKSVGIHRGTKVVVREDANLSIGNRTFINENSRVVCKKSILIGSGTSIAWGVTVADTDSHAIYIDGKLSNPDLPIKIGNSVWICANSSITKGADIEDNCIVGINSVVLRHKLKSNGIYVGNPVKFVKSFDSWGG